GFESRFQVQGITLRGFPQGGSAKRFGHRCGYESVRENLFGREAYAIAGDTVADFKTLGDKGGGNTKAQGRARGNFFPNDADFLHDTGEHESPEPRACAIRKNRDIRIPPENRFREQLNYEN